MSTALATQQEMAGLVEQVVVGGDLSKLSPKDRLAYYNAVCQSVKLNPLTRPFDYLQLSGRLVLYAKREAAEQLREIHGVSIQKLERETVEGIYVVTAYAKNEKGRTDSAIGAVPIENLRGEAKANAMMKAECVPLDSEILTRRGFKSHAEVVIGEEVLAYDPGADECVWTPLLNVTRYDSLPMAVLRTNSRFAVRCTPDHSWAVAKAPYRTRARGQRAPRGAYGNRAPDRFLIPATSIHSGHRIIMAAPERKATLGLLTPTEAAVLGWAVTDGTIQRRGRFVRVGICQSKEEHFSAIRALVNTLSPGVKEIVSHTPSRTFPSNGRTYATLPQHWWYLPSAVGRALLARAGFSTRKDLPAIAASLPGDARRAMLTAFMQAEGDKRRRFANGDAAILEAFQILAALEGMSTGRACPKPPIFIQRLKITRQIAGVNIRLDPSEPAPAWCPTTAYGTWVMRQDGQVTITGNTKAKRRVTLSICGLGMLDETEAVSTPDIEPARVDHETGEIIEGALNEGPLDPELERRLVLAQCTAVGQKLGLDADARAKIAAQFGVVGRTASLDAVNALLEHLRGMEKAKDKEKGDRGTA